ncbi:MAG: uroporphyrinogen-III synthase [Bacteroidales bacterium]|nr:uroporphyrinogen-III synthase [Bacteroidales bacterium]
MADTKILISQQAPSNAAAYSALEEKFGAKIEFKPFYLIEPLSSREFRAQRVNIPDFTAVTFSSRHAIDAFFKLCEELRIKVPETMKYFCTTEAVAMYLQKHIVYRKRKIFFGNGTADSILSQIGTKHQKETFLITSSASTASDTFSKLFTENGLNFKTAAVIKSVSQDLKDLDLHQYDVLVLHNAADIKALKDNFPDFVQGDLKIISYGRSVVRSMEAEGLKAVIQAPTPDVPSVAKAIEEYLKKYC